MRTVNEGRLKIAREVINQTLTISSAFKDAKRYTNPQFRGDEESIECPWHSDLSPSLSINDKRKLWHCLSCGAGGDYVNAFVGLIRITEGRYMKVADAVDYLIAKYPMIKSMLGFATVYDGDRFTMPEIKRGSRNAERVILPPTINDVYQDMVDTKRTSFYDICIAVTLLYNKSTPEEILEFMRNNTFADPSKVSTVKVSEVTAADLLGSLDDWG